MLVCCFGVFACTWNGNTLHIRILDLDLCMLIGYYFSACCCRSPDTRRVNSQSLLYIWAPSIALELLLTSLLTTYNATCSLDYHWIRLSPLVARHSWYAETLSTILSLDLSFVRSIRNSTNVFAHNSQRNLLSAYPLTLLSPLVAAIAGTWRLCRQY